MSSIGLEAFAPWPFKLLIDNVLNHEPLDPASFFGHFLSSIDSRLMLGYVVVALFLIGNIFLEVVTYLYSLSIKKLVNKVIFQFSKSAFDHMSHFDLSFFRLQEIGDYIYRLNYDVAALGYFIEETIIPLFSSSLYIIITTLIMSLINIKLTIISLCVLPFLAAGLYVFNKKIVSVTEHSERLNSGVFSFIQQALSQLRIIQAFSQEKKESSRFNEKLHTTLKTEMKLNTLSFKLTLLMGIVISLSYSLIIVVGLHDVLNGVLTTGLLIVFIFYLDNLTSPILAIIYALSNGKESLVKIDRMDDFFQEKTLTTDVGTLTQMEEHSISINSVTFIGNDDIHILDRISCVMKQGEITVIVGISGSGKSSLLSMIPRLLGEPKEGTLFIGQWNHKDYSLQTLRDNIGYVPQESDLFNDTIYNTIAYGKPGVSEEEVYKAARLADAEDFIHDQPHGLGTRIGESGNFLSGGQRQRLMLARAFIRDAPILLFDEPLAFLDIQTRSIVWKNIQKIAKNKTVVIVSNILSVISAADHIIVMNKGKIVEEGTHSTLLKPDSIYRLIVKDN